MMAIQDFQPASQSASLWPASLRPASLLPAPVPEPASHWPASLLSANAPESASHRSASCMSSPISESPFWGTLLAFKQIPTSKQSYKRRWGYPSSGYPLPSATDPLLPSAKELPTVQSGLQSAARPTPAYGSPLTICLRVLALFAWPSTRVPQFLSRLFLSVLSSVENVIDETHLITVI